MSRKGTRSHSRSSAPVPEWEELLEKLKEINSAINDRISKSTLIELIENFKIGLTSKIEIVKSDLVNSNDTIVSHEVEINSLKKRNKELQELIAEIQSSESDTKIIEENKNLQKIIQELRFEINELKNSHKEVSNIESEALQAKIVELQNQIKSNSNKNNTVTESNNNLQSKMAVEPKDAILAIPVISNELKEVDTFINTCDLYMQMADDEKKPTFLKIIKAKIRGEFLSRVIPLDECDTWDKLKKRLRDRLKKPVSYEFAQEDLASIFQKREESLEDYSKRVKEKLRRLNESSRLMANSEDEKRILMKANEKLAISKFEQNIRNDTVRVLVSASSKDSLDEAIQIARQRDLMERNKNTRKCSICGLSNHTDENCRRRKLNENKGNQKQNLDKSYKPFPSNSFKTDTKLKNNNNNVGTSNSQNTGNASANSGNSNSNQNYRKWNANANSNANSNSNTKNVRNVEIKKDNTLTLQQVLDEESKKDSKN